MAFLLSKIDWYGDKIHLMTVQDSSGSLNTFYDSATCKLQLKMALIIRITVQAGYITTDRIIIFSDNSSYYDENMFPSICIDSNDSLLFS